MRGRRPLDVVERIRIRYWANYVARFHDGSPEDIDRQICAAAGIPFDDGQRANFFRGLRLGRESSIPWAGLGVQDVLQIVEKNLGIKGSAYLYSAPLWDFLQGRIAPEFGVSDEIASTLRRLGFVREPYFLTRELLICKGQSMLTAEQQDELHRQQIQGGHYDSLHAGGCILDRAFLLALLLFEAHLLDDFWLAWSVASVIAELTASNSWWLSNGFGRDAQAMRAEFEERILHMKLLVAKRDLRCKVDEVAAYSAITTAINCRRNLDDTAVSPRLW